MRKKILIISSLFVAIFLLTGTALANVGELGGTTWRLVKYSIGANYLKNVRPDSDVTLVFDKQGKVTAVTGYNNLVANYNVFGTYGVNGRHLSIKNVSPIKRAAYSTKTIASVQEEEFMNAFKKTIGFRMAGGQLELLDSGGEIMATLVSPTTINVVSVPAAKVVPGTPVVRETKKVTTVTRVPERRVVERKVTVYRAGTMEATIEHAGKDEIIMKIDGRTYRMRQVVSASGAKYEEIGDSKTVFWSKGNTAHITVQGKAYPEYVMVPARTNQGNRVVAVTPVGANNFVYRLGNRDVVLNVMGDNEMAMIVDGRSYRMRRITSARGARYVSVDDPNTTFWTQGDTAPVTIKGEQYPEYTLVKSPVEGARNFAMLVGSEWKVQTINGRRLAPNSSATLLFNPDGSLSGKATINSYRTNWVGAGESVIIGGIASTMMAGPAALIEQESNFLKILENVRTYEVRDGTLILTTRDGSQITARK